MSVPERTMTRSVSTGALTPLLVVLALLVPTADEAAAQSRGGPGVTVSVELSTDVEARIRDFYASRPAVEAQALPPGIRRRLERGKALPPGIAKKTAPAELRSRVEVPAGYEIVEVGLDVLLVEVATSIVHDVLMDVIR